MKLQTNVFYISLLELAPKNTKLAIDIIVKDEEEEWDIEEVLNSRVIEKGQLEYLIKWLDFGLEDNL
jgi:hypothetical protein